MNLLHFLQTKGSVVLGFQCLNRQTSSTPVQPSDWRHFTVLWIISVHLDSFGSNKPSSSSIKEHACVSCQTLNSWSENQLTLIHYRSSMDLIIIWLNNPNLRVCSLQSGLLSPSDRIFSPESFRSVSLRSRCVRLEDWDLRTEDRASQLLSDRLQPLSLEKTDSISVEMNEGEFGLKSSQSELRSHCLQQTHSSITVKWFRYKLMLLFISK